MAFCPCFPALRPCVAPVHVEKHMHAFTTHAETALGYKYRRLFRSLQPGVRPIRRQRKNCTCGILSLLLDRLTDLGRSRLPLFRKCVEISSSTDPDCSLSFLFAFQWLNILMLRVDLLIFNIFI